MKSFVQKKYVDSNRCILPINSSHLATLLLKLQWHTTIYGETFHVNSGSNNTKYLKFCGQKVESTRNSNFGDYPGAIRLPGDWEIQSKIWSLLDYPGELTALFVRVPRPFC